jgi:hypothetical protein
MTSTTNGSIKLPSIPSTPMMMPAEITSRPFVRMIRHYYVFAYQMVFLIPMIQRSILTPDCLTFHKDLEDLHIHYTDDHLEKSSSISIQGGNHCVNAMAQSIGFQGTMFSMAFITLVFVAQMPDLNLKMIWLYLGFVAIICSFCAAWTGEYDAIPASIILCIAVGLVVIDISIRNIVIFLTTKKLKKLLFDTEQSAERAHAVEMRHMIANVAHDLKTVSCYEIPFLLSANFAFVFLLHFAASFLFYYGRRFDSAKFQ